MSNPVSLSATRQKRLAAVVQTLQLPFAVQLHCWTDTHMPAIQHLSNMHGWPTNHTPEEVLTSWRNAWPAIVAVKGERVVGYVRGLTDESITMHITDLLVAADEQKQGIGRVLLQACHLLYPNVLINLVAEQAAIPFYTAVGYRPAGEAYYYHKRFRTKGEEQ